MSGQRKLHQQQLEVHSSLNTNYCYFLAGLP